MSKSNRGFDDPIASAKEDGLNRLVLAENLYSVVRATPPDWSSRIGVYGSWGTGKTSVCVLLAEAAKKAGDLTVWVSPWGCQTTEEIWRQLLLGLNAELTRVGKPLGWFSKQKIKSLSSSRFIRPINAILGLTAAVSSGFSGADVDGAQESAYELIDSFLGKDEELILQLREQLGQQRILIFIDDLDRVEPSLLPKVLLSLRELLNLSKFTFVLPLDPVIVGAALQATNSAWKDPAKFLEKIIDYSISLPDLLATERNSFLRTILGNHFPPEFWTAIAEFGQYLPPNPRRTKLLARQFIVMAHEMERHRADELDWYSIVANAILRVESVEFAGRLVAVAFDPSSHEMMLEISLLRTEEDRDKARSSQLEKMLEDVPCDADTKKRLVGVASEWVKNRAFSPERVRYQVELLTRSHAVTWKEFDEIRANFARGEDPVNVLERLSQTRQYDRALAAFQVLETCISFFAQRIENAANERYLHLHGACIDDSVRILEVIEKMLGSNRFMEVISASSEQELLFKLLDVACRWHKFDGNAGDKKVRKAEWRTLSEWIHRPSLDTVSVAVELRKRMRNSFDGVPEIVKALSRELESHLRGEIRRGFGEREGMKYFQSYEKLITVAPILFNPKDELWIGDANVSIRGLLSAGSNADVVRENIVDFLEFAIEEAKNAGTDRKALILSFLTNKGISTWLWQTVISRRVQFRFLSGFQQLRQALIELGIPEASLKHPKWLIKKQAQ